MNCAVCGKKLFALHAKGVNLCTAHYDELVKPHAQEPLLIQSKLLASWLQEHSAPKTATEIAILDSVMATPLSLRQKMFLREDEELPWSFAESVRRSAVKFDGDIELLAKARNEERRIARQVLGYSKS